MIKIYSVCTFTGSHLKNFMNVYHAKEYARQLANKLDIDDDLIEISKINLTVEEFNYTLIED